MYNGEIVWDEQMLIGRYILRYMCTFICPTQLPSMTMVEEVSSDEECIDLDNKSAAYTRKPPGPAAAAAATEVTAGEITTVGEEGEGEEDSYDEEEEEEEEGKSRETTGSMSHNMLDSMDSTSLSLLMYQMGAAGHPFVPPNTPRPHKTKKVPSSSVTRRSADFSVVTDAETYRDESRAEKVAICHNPLMNYSGLLFGVCVTGV